MTNCEGVKMDFPYFTATCTHSRKAPNAKDVNHKILIKTDEDEEFIQVINRPHHDRKSLNL